MVYTCTTIRITPCSRPCWRSKISLWVKNTTSGRSTPNARTMRKFGFPAPLPRLHRTEQAGGGVIEIGPRFSIVIPLLNEEGNLELLHHKLTEVLASLT